MSQIRFTISPNAIGMEFAVTSQRLKHASAAAAPKPIRGDWRTPASEATFSAATRQTLQSRLVGRRHLPWEGLMRRVAGAAAHRPLWRLRRLNGCCLGGWIRRGRRRRGDEACGRAAPRAQRRLPWGAGHSGTAEGPRRGGGCLGQGCGSHRLRPQGQAAREMRETLRQLPHVWMERGSPRERQWGADL